MAFDFKTATPAAYASTYYLFGATSQSASSPSIFTLPISITSGKTFTVSNTLTLTGTDSTSFAFPGTSDTVVGLAATQTLTNKTITAPTINGGTHTAITSLGIRSTGSGAFDLTLANTENLTAGRTLTFTLNDAARTVNLGGNLTTAGALTTSGAFGVTLTATNTTSITLPVSGTLAILGANTFTATQTFTPGSGNALTINEVAGGSSISITGATQTASNPVLNATQTWNSSGVTFTGIKLNVTSTASAAASKLMDLQLGGTTQFFVEKDGFIGAAYGFGNSVQSSPLSQGISWAGANTFVTHAAVASCGVKIGGQNGGIGLFVVCGTNTTGSGTNSVVCNDAATATNATDGFLYIPGCAGTPTGTPTSYTGRVAMIYDTTNNKLYIYNGGWKGGTNPGTFTA